jgi:glutaredoxin/glutathione-dependent peroxiredoxin
MIKVGDTIPDVTLKQMTADGPADVKLTEYCADRKVVLFGVPGAFTPTCSEKHLPGFVQAQKDLAGKGVSAIACVSVADFFVMDAWGKSLHVGDAVDLLADGNTEFTNAAGLALDLSEHGLGIRCHRFALVVDNGVVVSMAVEENASQATVSSAESVLEGLA